VSQDSLKVRLCLYWMTELAKLDRSLSHYFIAVAFLHVAHKTATTPLEDELLDVLATTCLQSNDLRRCRNAQHSSVLSLSQAAMLMKIVAINSRSTVQLIEIELSKAYLYRALRCKDSDIDSVYCLANVYLAVLYFTTGQYQTAIEHCTLVSRSPVHSQCSSHVVQGELLPQMDNEIDNVLGLAVFYQYVRTMALSPQQQTQHVSSFTTELFAHYLCIRCLSVKHCHRLITAPLLDEIRRCQKHIFGLSEVFIADVLAFKSISSAKHLGHVGKLMFVTDETKPVPSGQLDTSELVELLKRSAVEHLTTFRQLEAEKSDPIIAEIVTTDFEALLAYKCGEYQRCLQLSTYNVHMLVGCTRMSSYVFAYPAFIQLLDDSIVSLIGLMLIVDPSSRERVGLSQLSLSLYLMTQCQMKLHHSVTSPADIVNYIKFARSRAAFVEQCNTLEVLTLKLTAQNVRRLAYL